MRFKFALCSITKDWRLIPLVFLMSIVLTFGWFKWSGSMSSDTVALSVDDPIRKDQNTFSAISDNLSECSDDIFSASDDLVREGCVVGLNGKKYGMTLFQRGTSIERIVVLDTGGPGLKSEAIKKRLPSASLPFLENTLTIAPDEGWESYSYASECSDALDSLINDGRSAKTNAKAASYIGQNCIPPSRFNNSLEALLNTIERLDTNVPVGIVAASFGANRLLSLKSDSLDRIDWLLLDSPFLSDSDDFPYQRLAVVAAGAIEHLPVVCGSDCDEIENWLELSADENFSLDTEIALLAIAGSPESNIEFLRTAFESENGDRKLPSADVAKRFLRSKFGFTYDHSWFGYWSELCPAFSNWSALPEQTASSKLEKNLVDFYTALHQPCQYYQTQTQKGASVESISSPRVCTVTGSYDPYVLPLNNEYLTTLSAHGGPLIRKEAGHLPLSYEPAMVEQLKGFVEGGSCAGPMKLSDVLAASELADTTTEEVQPVSLLDEMLAAEDAVSECMLEYGLDYVPFISQQTLQNLEILTQESTPQMYTAELPGANGSVASFGIASAIQDFTEQEQSNGNEQSEVQQNPNAEYANGLSDAEKEKYYTTLFGEGPVEGCAVSAYRKFDDRIRAMENQEEAEVPVQSDEELRDEIFGHADVKAEEQAVLQCLSDNGYEFDSVDDITVDLENRMANWMDSRADYEMNVKEGLPSENQKLPLMLELEQIKKDETELATVYSSCAQNYHAVVTRIAEAVLQK